MAISRPFAYNPSLTSISGATQVGNLAIATDNTALSNTNGSILFNSSPSQYLSIPNNAGFTQNQPFTIECWFYPTTLQGGYVWAMLQPNFLTVVYRNSGKFVIDMSYVGNPPGYSTFNRTYPINNWYHIALSWNGTNGWLFINGVVEWTFTGAGALVSDGNPLLIGQYQGQGQSTPLGNISNFRVVKGTAVYTSTFTPPTSPLTAISGTQLLLNTYSTNFLTDGSTNNFTVTNNGTVTVSSLSPFTNTTKWWNGPDESLGHVIAVPVATNTQPTPISGVSASVGFYRTSGFTDNKFITLSQAVSRKYGAGQTFSSATASKTWLNNNGFWTSYSPYNVLVPGLFKTTYSGYFGFYSNDVSWFSTATIASIAGNPATSSQTNTIFDNTSADSFSVQWLGYFKPPVTGGYTFYLNSDDASYLWVGDYALVTFNNTGDNIIYISNAAIQNGNTHAATEVSSVVITMTASNYYPIKILYGDRFTANILEFAFYTPTIGRTSSFTGLVFYNPQTNGFL